MPTHRHHLVYFHTTVKHPRDCLMAEVMEGEVGYVSSMSEPVPSLTKGTSRLILIARAFVDIEERPRIKLTRKHWECAGITDKDTRSRVIAKIRRECPGILLDAKRGRCTYIEFMSL